MAALILLSAALLSLYCPLAASMEEMDMGAGYYKREHSLVAPYQGSGMDVPYWEFGGHTVVTANHIRLTPDRQSKQGMLWNTVPVRMHYWEVLVHFQVHGSGKNLFGDGFAIWYTKERAEMGPVFGNRDYFTGLGVFLDTYSNHNGEHDHEHPYISAMINNGSLHYDHDRDGTHSQIAGCAAKFRNAKYDTYIAISYINRQIVVHLNIDGESEWKPCFMVKDIDLPTGYYFGATAATGELADNHDIISIKVYDVDSPVEEDGTQGMESDWSTVMPHAKNMEAPRPHVEDNRPLMAASTYRAISIGMIILLVVGILAVVGGMAFLKSQQKSRKHFF